MVKALLEWLKAILIAIVIVAIISVFFATTSVVSTSMYPSLKESNVLVLYKKGQIKRGDIITFKSNLLVSKEERDSLDFIKRLFIKEGDKKFLVKRVIALPGEKLEIRDGKVFINGLLLDESKYVYAPTVSDIKIDSLPENKYFVMGDNRENSLDSRSSTIGLVDKKDITGRALFRIYPFFDFKFYRGF